MAWLCHFHSIWVIQDWFNFYRYRYWLNCVKEPLIGQDLFTLTGKLLDYGCWCRIRLWNDDGGFPLTSPTLLPGHGTPVDALDEACKAWHQCKACASKDFNSCDPKDVVYEVGYDFYAERIDCQWNPSDCQVSSYL